LIYRGGTHGRPSFADVIADLQPADHGVPPLQGWSACLFVGRVISLNTYKENVCLFLLLVLRRNDQQPDPSFVYSLAEDARYTREMVFIAI